MKDMEELETRLVLLQCRLVEPVLQEVLEISMARGYFDSVESCDGNESKYESEEIYNAPVMFKLAAKFVHVTNDGVRIARRGVGTYIKYACYSLNDKKGTPSGQDSENATRYQPKYTLQYDCPEDFVLSQWSNDPRPYLMYRSAVAAYFFFMVFYTGFMGTLGSKIFIMLTYWSFYMLTLCQVLRVVNIRRYMKLKRQNSDIKQHLGNCRWIKTQWTLYNISVGSAPIVTFLFWTIAYDGSGATFINCNTHGVNAAFLLLDLLITRMPIRMLHMYHCCSVGLVYSIFTFLYWMVGGTNHQGYPYIYKVLNYGEAPGVALCYLLAILLLVTPLMHSMFFFMYRFRIFIHRYLRVMDKRNGVASE